MPTPPPSSQNDFGAWLLGSFIGTFLEGLLLLNTVLYYRRYVADAVYLKILVAVIVLLQTLTTIFTIHSCYYYAVQNFMNANILRSSAVWSSKLVPILGPTCLVVSEAFFGQRAIKLSGNRLRAVSAFAMLMIVVAAGFYIAVAVQAFQIADLSQSESTGSWLAAAGAALMLAGDIVLTVVLTYLFYTSRTGGKRSDSMLDILMKYTVGTGLLNCIFNLLSIALTAAFPRGIIFVASLLVSQQVYSNSVLISLNSRASIRRRAEDICICGTPFSSVRFNSDTVILEETDRSKGSGTAVSPGSDLPITLPESADPKTSHFELTPEPHSADVFLHEIDDQLRRRHDVERQTQASTSAVALV